MVDFSAQRSSIRSCSRVSWKLGSFRRGTSHFIFRLVFKGGCAFLKLTPHRHLALKTCSCIVAAICISLMPTTAIYSDAVDLYDCVAMTWSTARLSVSRSSLAAASSGSFAIFAGGSDLDGLLSTKRLSCCSLICVLLFNAR
jgi:hypothetical protein